MKFLRQFAAAAGVVAVVVLTGLAWNRFAPSIPGEGPSGHALVVQGRAVKVLPPRAKAPSGGKTPAGTEPPPGAHGVMQINGRSGTPGLFLGALLQPVNLAVLRHTAVLEAAVITAVVIVNASYRGLRRKRRGGSGVPPPDASEPF